ncbi:TRAP-type C4-dicarboxylate transport system permease small subunit [Endozoicomonas sp. NE40]|uniref:TRAP-type C4-dicarboxylate transport system permease small subunit n=1 Tax=Endozoicomonas lisbonensis TaxID=3120522 RepID=A0ABV2SI43_9GAMM
MDLLIRQLAPATRRIVSLFALTGCLAYCAMMVYGAWVYLDKIYGIGLGMEDVRLPYWLARSFSDDFAWEVLKLDTEDPMFPLWLAHSGLLLGFLLIGWRFFQAFWKLLTGEIEQFELADEARDALKEVEDKGAEK